LPIAENWAPPDWQRLTVHAGSQSHTSSLTKLNRAYFNTPSHCEKFNVLRKHPLFIGQHFLYLSSALACMTNTIRLQYRWHGRLGGDKSLWNQWSIMWN